MIFEYQTKKTFDEIIENLNHFKKFSFINPEMISINIESNQNLKKVRNKYSLLAIIFILFFNIISIFLYKDFKIPLIICSFLFLIIQYSVYTILDNLNSKFLKNYAIRFIKKNRKSITYFILR